MLDWIGDLEKIGWIGHQLLNFADMLTNLTRDIADQHGGWIAFIGIVVILPLSIKLFAYILKNI